MSGLPVKAVSLILLVAMAAPVAAQEVSSEERPQVPLETLIDRASMALRAVAGDFLMAPGDLEARRDTVMARLDLLIGALLDEGSWTLHSSVGDEAAVVLGSLEPGATRAEVTSALFGAGLTSAEAWQADLLAGDWLRLLQLVDRLRAAARSGPHRECPVPGDTWFSNNWGDDRPGGRSHKGIDLHAEFGAPVVAVEDGVVVQANWHRSGGRQIYIRADSTGDVFYFAHLEFWERWIWTGTRVEAGVVIGLLGDSGNADSPHLHFGWMPGSGDVELENLQNPYPLLLEICR